MTVMGKGKPFLEVLSSALHEDYRFPILEIFAFLYATAAFVFTSFSPFYSAQSTPAGAATYSAITPLLSLPLFIFVILVFKNIAYGLGSDLEKGIIQTYFSYPLKRWRILTAKLLSALGVSLLLFLTIQISALSVLAPEVVLPHLDTVFLTYAASLSSVFLIAGIMLLLTLMLRRGGITLVVGIVLYFAMSIITSIAMFFSWATGSAVALQVMAVISPNIALQQYFGGLSEAFGQVWTPTLLEVQLYVGASYVVVTLLFSLGYFYFSRRLNL